jgi:hypothetical protein
MASWRRAWQKDGIVFCQNVLMVFVCFLFFDFSHMHPNLRGEAWVSDRLGQILTVVKLMLRKFRDFLKQVFRSGGKTLPPDLGKRKLFPFFLQVSNFLSNLVIYLYEFEIQHVLLIYALTL